MQCRKFRDHYVTLAKRISKITEESGARSVDFRAVSCTAHRKLCQRFEMEAFPQVQLYRANDTDVTTYLDIPELHPIHVLNSLELRVSQLRLEAQDEESYPTIVAQSLRGWFQPSTNETKLATRRTKKQVFGDSYLSFVYSLRNEVFTKEGPLPPRRKRALLKWLTFLQTTLPFGWKVHRLIDALLSSFDSVCEKESEMMSTVDAFVDNPADDWSPACTKGDGMGYTCGLWQLLHIASVGVVEWNQLLPEDDKNRRMAVSALEAGDTLRNFIYHFFSCEECRSNFVTAYDNCFLDGCHRLLNIKMMTYWKVFPLWLIEMHNAVNVRLMKEEAEEKHRTPTPEDELAKKWPARHDCPKCWKEDGALDADIVLKYLRLEYW